MTKRKLMLIMVLVSTFLAVAVSLMPGRFYVGWLPFSVLVFALGLVPLLLPLIVMGEFVALRRILRLPTRRVLVIVVVSNIASFLYLVGIGFVIMVGYQYSRMSGGFNLISEVLLGWLWLFTLITSNILINLYITEKFWKIEPVKCFKIFQIGNLLLFAIPVVIYFVLNPSSIFGIWPPVLILSAVLVNWYLARKIKNNFPMIELDK